MTKPILPIEVPASSGPSSAITLLRYILTAVGGVLVSKGWLGEGDMNAIVGALLILIPAIVGIVQTRRNHAKQATMAARVPNRVAYVKGETK